MILTINYFQNRNCYIFRRRYIFNNGHPEIVALSPKNNNPNISASFLIIYKFLFVFCSKITSSSSLVMSFLFVGMYVLETFLDNSSTFLNIDFWERLKGRPSEIIRSAMAIVRRVLLEVINF